MDTGGLTKFAWVSIAAALATILLKGIAYYITGSVGLLSDALESIVNLVAALMALAMLAVASRPSPYMNATSPPGSALRSTHDDDQAGACRSRRQTHRRAG